MKSIKKVICAICCAALISSVPCTAYAQDSGYTPAVTFECSLSGVGAGKANFASKSVFFNGDCSIVVTNTAKAAKLAHEKGNAVVKPGDAYYPFGVNIAYGGNTPFPKGAYIKLGILVPSKMRACPNEIELYSLDGDTPARQELELTQKDGQQKLVFLCDISGMKSGTFSYLLRADAQYLPAAEPVIAERYTAAADVEASADAVTEQVTETTAPATLPETEAVTTAVPETESHSFPIVQPAGTTAETTVKPAAATTSAQISAPPVISPGETAGEIVPDADKTLNGNANPHTGVGALAVIPAAAVVSVILVRKRGRKRSDRR